MSPCNPRRDLPAYAKGKGEDGDAMEGTRAMTTVRSYQCNLCRTTIRDVGVGSLGRGFTFGHGRLEWNTVSQCENHLCDNCVNALQASFRDEPKT
jgi:hypothetical protein